MNIAASNIARPVEAGRPDAAPVTANATGFDADAADPAVASGTDVQDFGQILSDRLATGRIPVQDIADKALPTDSTPAAGTLASTTDPAQPGDKRIAVDPRAVPDIRATTAKADATDPAKSTKTADTDEQPADAVSTDLTSQLALVSQWAGLPPATVTPTASATVPQAADDTSAASSAATRGVKGKVDDVLSVTDRAAVARTTVIDVAQVQAAALPGALEAAAFAINYAARPTASSGAGVVATAKSDTTRTGEATPVAASDSRTAAIDKLFALAGGNTAATPSDTSSITSQFVAQISAQVSNAQNTLGAVPTAAAAAALQEPVGSTAWSHELGQTAIRMATNDLQNASLRLNPEHLGPLDVQMRIDNGVAHMQFTAAHAETRQALESSRTTLDQMFSDQGLKLGDWSVGNSSQNGSFARNFAAGSPQGDGTRSSGDDTDGLAADTLPVPVATRPLGLVDTFA